MPFSCLAGPGGANHSQPAAPPCNSQLTCLAAGAMPFLACNRLAGTACNTCATRLPALPVNRAGYKHRRLLHDTTDSLPSFHCRPTPFLPLHLITSPLPVSLCSTLLLPATHHTAYPFCASFYHHPACSTHIILPPPLLQTGPPTSHSDPRFCSLPIHRTHILCHSTHIAFLCTCALPALPTLISSRHFLPAWCSLY